MTVDFELLIKSGPSPDDLSAVVPLPAFAQATLGFIEALSEKLFKNPQVRQYPELTALAFWMRKSNLTRLHQLFIESSVNHLWVARGTVFHIAPANVDTIFVYSWVFSLLSGNKNIVRVSSKHSAQTEILIESISDLLSDDEHCDIQSRNVLLRYPANDRITAYLSLLCDVRTIWGGDDTVKQIRSLPLPPTSIELAFANKYSLALINAEQWQASDDKLRDRQIELFWNDAYWFDQMACSSPRLILWVGSAVEAAMEDFWARLDKLLTVKQTKFSDADYVNKLIAADSLAIEADATVKTGSTNALVRVQFAKPALYPEQHCGAGLFFESSIATLEELCPLLTRTVQTVSYFGWPKQTLREFVLRSPLAGIDRIVPFGSALDFAPVWDGFDLTRAFMREITIS